MVYLLCASVSDRNYWSTVNTKWPLICGRKRYTSGLWILVQIVFALECIALNHLLCLYAWDNTPTGCCAATRWYSLEKKSAWYKLGIQYSRSVYALDNGVRFHKTMVKQKYLLFIHARNKKELLCFQSLVNAPITMASPFSDERILWTNPFL